MKFTSREIFGIFLVLIEGLLSMKAWESFFALSLHSDMMGTLWALLWFSLLGTIFFLGMIVWGVKIIQILGAVLLFVPSFLFVRTWYHGVFVFFSCLLAWMSVLLVQKEMDERIHFRFFRTAEVGSFICILALSLSLSSVYFSSIQTNSWEELVPRFSIGQGTAITAFKTVAYFNPEWKQLTDQEITVDGFLRSLPQEKVSSGQVSGDAPSFTLTDAFVTPALEEYMKKNGIESGSAGREELFQELTLQARRNQISLLVGKPLKGDEKIVDVFSLAIQHKILTALSGPEAAHQFSPNVIPLVLAVLLFLTLLPIGSVLALLWMALSTMLFSLARLFHWVILERLDREQEVLRR